MEVVQCRSQRWIQNEKDLKNYVSSSWAHFYDMQYKELSAPTFLWMIQIVGENIVSKGFLWLLINISVDKPQIGKYVIIITQCYFFQKMCTCFRWYHFSWHITTGKNLGSSIILVIASSLLPSFLMILLTLYIEDPTHGQFAMIIGQL